VGLHLGDCTFVRRSSKDPVNAERNKQTNKTITTSGNEFVTESVLENSLQLCELKKSAVVLFKTSVHYLCSGNLPHMPTLKLHYDGWIALQAELLQALGLSNGDRVTVDLVDGALVLQPVPKRVSAGTAKNVGTAIPAEPEQGMLRLVDEPSLPGKARQAIKAPVPKRRGRPPKAAAEVELPRIQASPIVGIGPAKLIKKAELAAKMVPQEEPTVPAARIRPERVSQPVERRPFRNVEVRTLGPKRRHNRTRRLPPESTI
jgi:hypothetical protein